MEKGERNITQAEEQQDFNLICNKNKLFSFDKNILEAIKRKMSNCQFWMGFILVCILISIFIYISNFSQNENVKDRSNLAVFLLRYITDLFKVLGLFPR